MLWFNFPLTIYKTAISTETPILQFHQVMGFTSCDGLSIMIKWLYRTNVNNKTIRYRCQVISPVARPLQGPCDWSRHAAWSRWSDKCLRWPGKVSGRRGRVRCFWRLRPRSGSPYASTFSSLGRHPRSSSSSITSSKWPRTSFIIGKLFLLVRGFLLSA